MSLGFEVGGQCYGALIILPTNEAGTTIKMKSGESIAEFDKTLLCQKNV